MVLLAIGEGTRVASRRRPCSRVCAQGQRKAAISAATRSPSTRFRLAGRTLGTRVAGNAHFGPPSCFAEVRQTNRESTLAFVYGFVGGCRGTRLTNTARPETGSCAHIGGREEQQDRVAVLTDGDAHLLVLADGMGGHSGGAMAAQALVDAAREEFTRRGARPPPRLLADVVRHGHERINVLAACLTSTPQTTCVLLYADQSTQAWAHVGDSRLYRFNSGRLVERTLDHSVVELMRLQGKITEAEMKTHPSQNRVYDALGGQSEPRLAAASKPAAVVDGFILASDGLWSHVREVELETALCAQDLSAALQALVVTAVARGGTSCDNISVAAIRYRRPGWLRRSVYLAVRRAWQALGARQQVTYR